jgi:hypothetical protein
LCTSTEEGHIQIFGPEGECRNLANKIKVCLPVSVSTHTIQIYRFILLSCKVESNVLWLPLEIGVLLNGLYRPNLGVTSLAWIPLQLTSADVLYFVKAMIFHQMLDLEGRFWRRWRWYVLQYWECVYFVCGIKTSVLQYWECFGKLCVNVTYVFRNLPAFMDFFKFQFLCQEPIVNW